MSKPTLRVLYGSQTGSAQDTAQRIARQAQRRQLLVQVLALNSYNVVSVTCVQWGSKHKYVSYHLYPIGDRSVSVHCDAG